MHNRLLLNSNIANSHCHLVALALDGTPYAVAVTIVSYGNIIVAVKYKIQLVEVVFTEAT